MIYKLALTENTPIEKINNSKDDEVLVRFASGSRIKIEPGTDKERVIKAEIKKHPNALFFRSKAIEADKINNNGDYFSEDELLKAYKSFEGKPFFTNHDNQNIENAKGKIVFAEWDDSDKSVYTISFVDRDAYPHICRSIEEEYTTGVSMGCSVECSSCSICGNVAERTEDYCTHIRNRKGRTFTGKARNVKTGKLEEFKDADVFEYNFGLKFIELSAVVDPACPTCNIEGIVPNEDYLSKVAKLENNFRVVKTAAMEKDASQEEIQQIEQVLETLEGIAVNLIKNRQQVEVEFASDLVEILSNLQEWHEELVGAGYGSIQEQDDAGQVPGTIGDDMQGGEFTNEQAPDQPMDQNQPAPQPVSAEEPVEQEDAAARSGEPNIPDMPVTAPVRPKTSMEQSGKAINMANNLIQKMNKTGGSDMTTRRTASVKNKEKERTKQVLSEAWQGKQDFLKYIENVPNIQDNNHKLSVKQRDGSFIIVAEDKGQDNSKVWTYEDLDDEEKRLIKESPREAAKTLLKQYVSSKDKIGEKRMASKNMKEAGANSVNATPETITERQLDEQQLYHRREDSEREQITQKQLDEKRKGEKDYITENQLNDDELNMHPRDEEREVVTEAQMEQMESSNRQDDPKNEITQAQLDSEGNRVNQDKNEITEKQLSDMSEPWARVASRDSAKFKTASDHMSSVVDAISDTCIETGATPEEIQTIASTLINGTKARVKLASTILEEPEEYDAAHFAGRANFWAAKNIKVASAHPADVEKVFINKLRKIASDETINPDTVIDAVDVISEGDEGITSISRSIDNKMKEIGKTTKKAATSKQQLREALSGKTKTSKKDRDSQREKVSADVNSSKQHREAERREWEMVLRDDLMNPSKVGKADTIIQTSVNEIGTERQSKTFKQDIYNFTKGALTARNVKMAGITNVTVDKDGTIQVAVQTGEDEEVENLEIPAEDQQEQDEGQLTPEGDMSGEGLDDLLDSQPETGEEQPEMNNPNSGVQSQPAMAKNKDKITREAQSPMGGGVPQTPEGVSAPGASEDNIPQQAPEGADAVQTLMQGEQQEDGSEEVSDEIPTVGEQQPPWSICPECGSNDVDVESPGDGSMSGTCNNCGAEFEAEIIKTVEFKVIKPTKSVGEEGSSTPEEPEEPGEVPALPVAASINLDKGSMKRMAKNLDEHGHVCPACGTTGCEPITESEGHTEAVCASCNTTFNKDILVSSKNPSKSMMRISWDVHPNTEDCSDCKEKAQHFAAKVKMQGLLKEAASKKDEFPKANCIERIARTYGSDTIASFGPCKGKLLANCVCNQLQKLGFTKVRHLKKLASASMDNDPWDDCINDQLERDHTQKEAETICGCIRKKYATADDDNIYLKAFADEKYLTAADLRAIKEIVEDAESEAKEKIQNALDEEDIGDDLPPVDEVEVDVDVEDDTTPEHLEEVEDVVEDVAESTAAEDMEEELEEAVETDESEDSEPEDTEEEAEEAEETEETPQFKGDEEMLDTDLMAMDGKSVRRSGSKSNIKLAEQPKQVKDIEGNVDSGVPRSKSTLGNEGKDNIDVELNDPNIPRNKSTMGNESQDNIDKPADNPDVAVDSSYMGEEQKVQNDMPDINNDIKGTVIAEEKSKKSKKQAKKLKEVDTVEKDVDSGVPRSDSNLGHEGKDNIDVDTKEPQVPRNKSTMGNEGKDNIDVDTESPDVPVDSAYQGNEKEVQKDMPDVNDEYLKLVRQKRDDQMDRIIQARKDEARNTAAFLMAQGRIAEDRETFEHVVTSLSQFEIDKIGSAADKMFPEKVQSNNEGNKRQASNQQEKQTKQAGHSVPGIVLESQQNTGQEEGLQDKISNHFTIGNSKFDNDLTVYGEK